jgi:hypothetical protein
MVAQDPLQQPIDVRVTGNVAPLPVPGEFDDSRDERLDVFQKLAGCTDPTLSKNGRLIELA